MVLSLFAPPRRSRLYKLIRSLVRPYWVTLAAIFISMAVQTVMNVAAPWPLKVVLDSVVGEHKLPHSLDTLLHDYLGGTGKMHIALGAAIAVLIIAVLGAIASYIAHYYTTSLGQWVANDLRIRTYHHLQELSLKYYDTHDLGTMLSTLTADVQTIQGFASSSTPGILVDLLTIVAMLGFMFWLNWDFTLIILTVTPIMLLLISRIKKAVKKATREVRKEQSKIMSVAQQGLESIRVVKAFGRQDLEVEELTDVSKATVEAALKARRVKALVSPLINIVVAICTAFVLWRSSRLILSGLMTAGALTVFLAYLTKFFKPVQDLATMTNTIAQTAVGVERVRAILEDTDVLPEKPDAADPTPFRGSIRFKNVSFAYNQEAPVLRDVDFEITAGQMIGLVGPTGGGKSTIVSLIPRFYDPTSGQVLVDEVDVRNLKVKGLRDQIAYVLQETVLFHGTVAENIAYGRGDATRDEIVAAAKIANADEFISRMPGGYDAMIGDRGETLSGGQRQRIGIARAIIRNNPILILDEPTAALDTESEELVVEALARAMKGRTVIAIAHRLSTIKNANRILVLKNGVIAEQGTHEELLAMNGIYAELHRVQFETAASRPPA